MAKYKYESAHAWLIEWAGKLNPTELFNEFTVLAQKLDADEIQDTYQNEMDNDGYFSQWVTCPQCEGQDKQNCNYCDGEGIVTEGSADEWHRQNDEEAEGEKHAI